jgi:hypothetical protein
VSSRDAEGLALNVLKNLTRLLHQDTNVTPQRIDEIRRVLPEILRLRVPERL